MSRASVSLSRSSLPSWISRLAISLASLAETAVQRAAQDFLPAVGVRRLERFQRAMMFRGGNGFQHRAELDAVLHPDLRGGDFARGGRQAGGMARNSSRAKIASSATAGCVRWCEAMSAFSAAMISLAAAALSFKSDASLSISADHGHARLQSLGRAKIPQQAVLQRRFLRLINHRLGFFQRHDEMAVLFHFAPGGFPPFLPVVADDIRHEHLLNLVRRRLAAEAVQHDLDQIQMMRGQLAQTLEVGGLAREDVVLGNRLERFGGERQIHRVTRLARKINREPREHRVHRLDSAEAPAAVRATAASLPVGSAAQRAALRFFRRRPVFQIPLS